MYAATALETAATVERRQHRVGVRVRNDFAFGGHSYFANDGADRGREYAAVHRDRDRNDEHGRNVECGRRRMFGICLRHRLVERLVHCARGCAQPCTGDGDGYLRR